MHYNKDKPVNTSEVGGRECRSYSAPHPPGTCPGRALPDLHLEYGLPGSVLSACGHTTHTQKRTQTPHPCPQLPRVSLRRAHEDKALGSVCSLQCPLCSERSLACSGSSVRICRAMCEWVREGSHRAPSSSLSLPRPSCVGCRGGVAGSLCPEHPCNPLPSSQRHVIVSPASPPPQPMHRHLLKP